MSAQRAAEQPFQNKVVPPLPTVLFQLHFYRRGFARRKGLGYPPTSEEVAALLGAVSPGEAKNAGNAAFGECPFVVHRDSLIFRVTPSS